MHVLLIPIGSHGDVHPFVGLGIALKARGHRVTLITNDHFRPLATQAGLPFIALGTDAEFLRVTENPDLWHPMKGFKLVMGMMGQLVRPLYDIIESQHVPGETLMAAQVTAWGARVAHDRLGIPIVSVHLQPSVMMSAIDPPKLPGLGLIRKLPLWGRRAILHAMFRYMLDPRLAPPINGVRKELGLPPARDVMNWWHSPQGSLALFPDWFAPPQADWPPNVRLAGFPLFDESGQRPLDPDVSQFLEAGTPPVVFTAGSAMRHGHEFFRAAADACAAINRRGILLARFDEQIPTDLPPTVRHFNYVPFSRLLPRAAAIVHHGGIGTTAQGLAAGVPQLVMPLAHDQPDNAARLEELGVGASLWPKHFKGPAVAARLAALLGDPAISSRARALADRVRAQDTEREACEFLESACDIHPNTRSAHASA